MTTRAAYDFIVIGAGASGCAVAGRLAEDPHNRVLLVEAGRRSRNPLLSLPGLAPLAGAAPRYNWAHQTEPIPGLGNRRLTVLQGRVLGGSSSINGMVYTRGHPREYDLWRQLGCDGWGYDDVLPFFKKLEGQTSDDGNEASDGWHGIGGPVTLSQVRPSLPICDAFLAAAAESGFPVFENLHREIVDGFGYYDANVGRGRRISAAVAYLGKPRPNLTVLTEAEARRIIVESGRARGVELRRRGERITIWAEREVVVSAGALKTPQLLMLSGIGPADHLSQFGIPVIVDSPQVGRNLQNHVCYRPRYACSGPVTAYKYLQPGNAVAAALSYMLFRSGPLAESLIPVGGFFRTDPSLEIPDIQVVFLAGLPGAGGARLRDFLPSEHGVALTIYQGTPYSRGEVRLGSADPAFPMRIYPNYFEDSRDLEVLAKGLERMREVMLAPALRRHIRCELSPGRAVNGPAALAEDIRRNAATAYHQSGTCVMGSRPESVVDPQLRVRGIAGLRVADTSIIPRLPNATLHGPALMIGEKAAAMIAAG